MKWNAELIEEKEILSERPVKRAPQNLSSNKRALVKIAEEKPRDS